MPDSARILIISACFYEHITDLLLSGAIAVLDRLDVTHERVDVPGAFEIPAAIRMAIESKSYDGYVALGCVIRGETSHYDYVCGESARGLQQLALEHCTAIGYGILTVENEAQALERADPARGNKGGEAAQAALRMMELRRQFRRRHE